MYENLNYSIGYINTNKILENPLSVSSNPVPLISTDNNPNWSVLGGQNQLDYTVLSADYVEKVINSDDLNILGGFVSEENRSQKGKSFVFENKNLCKSY
ncbi:hypothetical protein IMG5_124160 [Ichthyophthirius multifiliis]|uniref:Uncharacterized protein n=1 Tax=Ichthyophthirius multifiliis TaxID=5932 RepID=G0QVJ0_ICHMU|nr:hypothetical protein IMG5_124160 [Ichthyophthirius multifiliis]EGR30750.1 hypothetical protein IMG5_124160 [Ichthyophthirius multifiliis]|eukprot:XP_004032337.1 hypothetical protein IMG5_124160 [Ichthyophthirius multifiliis]